MNCNTCHQEVTITAPHEQFLWDAGRLCPECRDSAIEESYRDQDDLKCCRFHEWADELIICEKRQRPVSSVGICSAFEPAA